MKIIRKSLIRRQIRIIPLRHAGRTEKSVKQKYGARGYNTSAKCKESINQMSYSVPTEGQKETKNKKYGGRGYNIPVKGKESINQMSYSVPTEGQKKTKNKKCGGAGV